MSGTALLYTLLGLTVLVGCSASLSIRPEIRGWRNLAILASLLLGVISPFVAGGLTALIVWSVCALGAAVAYHIYEFWAARRHPLEDGAEEDPGQSIAVTFRHALFLWPLLVFDTFENTCAELFPAMLGGAETDVPVRDTSASAADCAQRAGASKAKPGGIGGGRD